MLVSINSALGTLDQRFQQVDLDGIQRIVNTFSDPKTRDAVKADPHNFMIREMKKNNVPNSRWFAFSLSTGQHPCSSRSR